MLWLLRPRDFLPDDDNPWNPWYDKCFGFVIRADSEKEARKLANENGRDENRGEFLNKKVAHTTSPWLDERYSTCINLSDIDIGPSRIIMQDNHAA